MLLSVIVLNYNVKHFLYLCLQSVSKSIEGLDAEVIVVDNASSDGSCKMVKQYFPEFLLLENKENVGFAKANNQAVKHAKGEYLCILNPDTVVTETTFINSIQKAKTIPDIGILGVQLVDGKGQFLPESKRNIPTPKVSILKMLGKGNSNSFPYYAKHVKKDSEGEVSVLVGAFMLVKASVYREANGFDEYYFMYGEDIDLSYKVEKLGYRNYYYGCEKIIHFKGESTLKDNTYRKRFFGAMKIFYQKHFRSSVLINFIIELGIRFSYIFQLKGKKIKELPISFEKGVLLSGNKELVEKIYNKTGLKVDLINLNGMYFSGKASNTLCYFDMNEISYSQALMIINSNSDTNYFYRFIPENYHYTIGSDSSKSRGRVISLK